MEELVKRIDELLRQKFPGATTELEAVPGENVSGFLYWQGFEDEEQLERQRRVWDVLRATLTPDERQNVSAIFTLTPDEISAIREG